MSDGNDFSMHRMAITDALKGVSDGVRDIRGELSRMTREVDSGTAKLITRADALEAWRVEAEKRLRALEESSARSGAYVSLAALAISGVVSLVVGLIVRAVGR